MGNCIRPVNWKNCQNPQEWMLPELLAGLKLLTGEVQPYQQEQEILRDMGR
jgi:hypothetical protein